jgi:hypothetical protein
MAARAKIPSDLVMQARLIGRLGALVDGVSDGKVLQPQTLHLVGLAIRALRNSDTISDEEERRGNVGRVESIFESGLARLKKTKTTKHKRYLEAIDFVTAIYLNLWNEGYVRLVQRIQRVRVDSKSDTGGLFDVLIATDPRESVREPFYVGVEVLALLVLARYDVSWGARDRGRWSTIFRDYLIALALHVPRSRRHPEEDCI